MKEICMGHARVRVRINQIKYNTLFSSGELSI
jgi:hypothetical protein